MADIAEEYRSSLSELNFNSKPHINMLTMLAEENAQHASVIVQTIVDHINSVTPDIKLPSLYLVDSIVKNVGESYVTLFSKHLVSLFTSVFEKVDENIRSLLYKLRSTWTGIFPNAVLLHLDTSVECLDPAWPILAKSSHKNIHVNPKFLDKPSAQLAKKNECITKSQTTLLEVEMKKKQLVLMQALQEKKQELMELRKKAALTPVVESSKVDIQKKINARDPRLTKKVLAAAAAAAANDSATLQSVVVVPKGNPRKRNEKGSLSLASKKMKLEDMLCNSKKDDKYKLAGFGGSSKLNVAPNHQTDTTDIVNVQKDIRAIKRPLDHKDSALLYSELDKSNKIFKSDVESKAESDIVLQKKINVNLDQSKQTIVKMHDSHIQSAPKEGNITKDMKYQYNHQSSVMVNEVFDKNTHKLEPPPPPPSLFLGNEDKDYRILPKNLDDMISKTDSYPERISLPVVKSFKLDNKERKVYFVNDRSFAFTDDNFPRELTFEGPPQHVFIEGLSQPIELRFGGHEVKFDICGKFHFIRFGTPAREIYINNHPYEASFGGPPFTAVLDDGKVHRIRISGPAPQVVLSKTPANELYERFCQNNQEFLKKFDNERVNNDISSKLSVATHDVDMRVNSNKLSSAFFNFPLEKVNDIDWKRIHVGNSQQIEWNIPKNSFETVKDVNPNFVTHRNYSEAPDWNRSLPLSEMHNSLNMPPPLPPKQMINRFPGIPSSTTFGSSYSSINAHLPQFSSSDCGRSMPQNNGPILQSNNNGVEFSAASQFNKSSIIPRLSPPPLPPFLGTVPNTSCMTSLSMTRDLIQTSAPYNNTTVTARLPMTHNTAGSVMSMPPMPMARLTAPVPVTNVTVANQMQSTSVPVQVPTSTTLTTSNNAPVNMDLFLEKLVAAGLIGKSSGTSTPPSVTAPSSESEKNGEDSKEESPKEDSVPELAFEPKCLKQFYAGVISALHNGSQCATCGMRFKEIQSEQYSRHLDWHFRRNRREKDGAKKPFSRRLFYEIKDWVEFKEFEDVDERAPSYFELQASGEQAKEALPENICSVQCSDTESEKCAVCGEQFQLFWVEEEEEWHLRNAVKHNDQVYHPACYEDYEKANNSAITDLDTSFDETKSDIKADIEDMDVMQADPVNKKGVIDEEDVTLKKEDIKVEIIEKDEHKEVAENCKKEEEVKIEKELEVKIEKELEVKIEKELEVKVEKGVEIKIEKDDEVKVVKDDEVKMVQDIEVKTEKVHEVHELKEDEMKDKKEDEEMVVNDDENTEEVISKLKEIEVVVKVEPMDTDEAGNNAIANEESQTATAESEKSTSVESEFSIKTDTVSDVEPVKSEGTDKLSQSTSQNENVPTQLDESEEIQFRPPTPDPKFQVLPPVSKGTEISNLCTIM